MIKTFFKIIIPNYNNYLYIKKCLDSILSQSFQDFHIIIVDDQSTDQSYKICKIYEKRNPEKITVIKPTEKLYAGGCRNVGLEYDCQSEYIWFVDGDDYIEENALQNIYETIRNNNYPDCIFCNNRGINNQGIIYNIKDKYEKLTIGAAPWRYCINKKFQTIRFQPHVLAADDVVWFVQLMEKVQTIKSTSQIVYTYNDINPNRSSNKIKNNSLSIVLEWLSNFKSEDNRIKALIDSYKINFEKMLLGYQQDKNIKYRNTLTLEQVLENSYVITIDDEIYNRFVNIFSRFFSIVPKRYDGFQVKELSGPQNCSLSHLGIVKMAKEMNLPFVCIFEDDAYPVINVRKDIIPILKEIPYNADVLLLGWSNCGQNQSLSRTNNIVTTWFSGSHAYIIFRECYDRYIEINEKTTDIYADNTLYKNFVTYIPNKPLFIQYSINKSMNNHVGYIYKGNHLNPPMECYSYEQLMEKEKIATNNRSILNIHRPSKKILYDKKLYSHTELKNKILILTSGTKNLQYQYSKTNINKQKYAEKYNIAYKFQHIDIKNNLSYHSRKDLLLQYIGSEYEWIMWMDCDAWFNNFEIDLNDIINNVSDSNTHLIICDDCKTQVMNYKKFYHDCYVNSGVLIFRNSEISQEMIKIWKNPTDDQVQWMKTKSGLNDQPYISSNLLWNIEYSNHTKILDYRIMNCFTEVRDENGNLVYVPEVDSFIIHAAGNNKKDQFNKLYINLSK